MNYIIVQTTFAKKEVAEALARQLVEQKLSACVQIVGLVTSVYSWQNTTETAREYLCLIKTKSQLFKRLEKFIKQNHPYQLPEIVALPISAASPEYLAWLDTNLKQ